MSDYRLEFKVRNGRFLKALEAAGYRSAHQLCKQHGINYQAVAELLRFKTTPMDTAGEWRKIVREMCDALGVLPDDLFSPAQRTMALPTNRGVREIAEPELLRFMGQTQQRRWELDGAGDPLALLEHGEREPDFDALLDSLSSNPADTTRSGLRDIDRKVLKMRFKDEKTLDEVAAEIGVTRERVRQLEARALRNLRARVSAKRALGFDPHLPLPPEDAELDDLQESE